MLLGRSLAGDGGDGRAHRRTPSPVGSPHLPRPGMLRHNRAMPASAARTATDTRIAYDDILSDDGTRLRAWTNDPDGLLDGPTVVLCNGLGTGRCTWPALLEPDCGVASSPGTTAAPAAPTGPATRAESGSRSSSRTRCRSWTTSASTGPCSWAGRWASTPCSSSRSATPSGSPACSRWRACPGDTFATMLGAAPAPPRRRPRAHRQPRPRAEVQPAGRSPRSPPGSRSGRRRSPCSPTPGSCSRCPTRSWPRPRVKEFLATPVDWYFHLALAHVDATPGSASATSPSRPCSSPPPRTSCPAPATWRPRRADPGGDVRRAPRQPLHPDGAAGSGARAAARLPGAGGLTCGRGARRSSRPRRWCCSGLLRRRRRRPGPGRPSRAEPERHREHAAESTRRATPPERQTGRAARGRARSPTDLAVPVGPRHSCPTAPPSSPSATPGGC